MAYPGAPPGQGAPPAQPGQYGAQPGYQQPPPGQHQPPPGQPAYPGQQPPPGQPPAGQYGAPPPGQAPPGQYGQQPPPGQYGAPPAHGQPPAPGGYPAPQYGAPGHHAPPPQNPQLMQFFQAVDTDRSGHIDSAELVRALSSCGFSFSKEAADIMIKMFDKDKSGKIGFAEFQSLHEYITQMQNAFKAVDRDQSGSLSAQEISGALTTSGYQLSQQTLDGLMRKFDRSKRGHLSLDGYIELCCFLGTARNVFSAFDTQRSGTISLQFDNFIYASNMLHA